MWILFGRNILALLLLAVCVSVSALSRPIVQVVFPNCSASENLPCGTVNVIDLGNGRSGMPAGFLGTQGNPISLQDTAGVTLWIGDTNTGFPPGFPQINDLNPWGTFHTGSTPSREDSEWETDLIGELDVNCVGLTAAFCNGSRLSINILTGYPEPISWTSWPLDVARSMVARVSLGVEATDRGVGIPFSPNPTYDADNSVLVEVWFTRSAGNGPPIVSAGSNQTVHFGQTVSLHGTVVDPDGDFTTVWWALVGGTGNGSIQLNGANSLTATFTAPSQSGVLTFQFCANDGEALPVCANTTVTVGPPRPIYRLG